jgi:peptide/nickel transport system substrate-binding protein
MNLDDDIEADLRATSSRRGLILGGGALAAFGGVGAWKLIGDSRARAESLSRPSTSELVVAIDGAATSKFVLDPQNSAYAPHHRMMRSIYDNLTLLLPDHSIAPWLAESWEISPDQTTYDFKLRKGVRFHDGTSFDAHAVAANFRRVGDPKGTLQSRRILGPFKSVEVLAEDVVRLNLKTPYTPLLRNLSTTRLAMVSPTAAAKYGKAFGQHPVGTGPFRFVGLSPGTEVRLARNPDYQWSPSTASHSGPPLIDRLTFKNVPEQATRMAVMLSGQAHVADLVPPQDIAAIEVNRDYELFQKELLNTNYSLTLNVENDPWGDEEVRRAFKLGIDIDTIVGVIYRGTLRRAWSPLSPGIYGSLEKELTGSWAYDPARSDAIFDSKGWVRGHDGVRVKDGKRLTVLFMESQGNREKRLDVVQLVRHQLLERGVELRLATQPPGSAAEMARNNSYELSGGAQFAPDPDVLRSYYSPSTQSAASVTKIHDPDVIAWLDEAAQEPDNGRRAALYGDVQRRIIDKTYAIPIYVLLYNIAASRQVSGLTLDAHGFPEFNSVRLNT